MYNICGNYSTVVLKVFYFLLLCFVFYLSILLEMFFLQLKSWKYCKNHKFLQLLSHSGSICSRCMVINAARCLAFRLQRIAGFLPVLSNRPKPSQITTPTFQDTQTKITLVDQNAGCRCTSSFRFREHGTWPSTWALCLQEVHVFVIICEPVSWCLVICGWRTCRHVH